MVHPVQSVIESLYAAGRCPRLHVNATAQGVVCPDFIREQWQERLIIDLDSTYPLSLAFNDEGIGVDLSFGGYITRCSFPWKAIYVVADRATGRGIVLDQNMPEAVRRSRHQPVTGPLTPPAELRPVQPDAESSEAAPARGKATTASSQPTALKQGPEGEVQRRRAAFRVIDGGG